MEKLTCPNTSATFVPTYIVSEMNRRLLFELRRARSGLVAHPEIAWLEEHSKRLSAAARELDCQFDGEVEVRYTHDGVRHWTCPDCGTEHEDDLSDDFAEEAADQRRDALD